MYSISDWMLTKTQVGIRLNRFNRFVCFLNKHPNTLVVNHYPEEIRLKYTLSNRNVFEETMDKLAGVVCLHKNMSMTNCRYSNEINLTIERV